MRRKIIKQGASSLTLSLPAKWAKLHGLEGGDEVEVQESKDAIKVSPVSIVKQPKVELDLSTSHPLTNRIVRAQYIKGIDELHVKLKDAQQLRDLQHRALPELLGYVIVEQTSKTALIRDVTHPAPEEFETLFRRVFLLLVSMGEEFEREKEVENILAMDQNINRNVNFCLRLCAKNIVSQPPAVQSALVLLELLGDAWKEIAKSKTKVDKDLVIKYNKFFHSLYELWFNYDALKAVLVAKKYQELEPLLKKSELKNLASISIVLLGLLLSC